MSAPKLEAAIRMAETIRRNLKRPDVKRIKDPAVRLSVAKYYDCLKRLGSE